MSLIFKKKVWFVRGLAQSTTCGRLKGWEVHSVCFLMCCYGRKKDHVLEQFALGTVLMQCCKLSESKCRSLKMVAFLCAMY